jgi:hypothetical protein
LHAPITQALATQLAPALAKLHELPHTPQFPVVFVVFTSQPVPQFRSQLPHPALQA